MTHRYTSHEELTRRLLRAGFERRVCPHWAANHESWERRPMGGATGSTLPLYAVHLTVPTPSAPRRGVVAHGFAYGGPKDTDEHWEGRFATLTAAADWADAHGRSAA